MRALVVHSPGASSPSAWSLARPACGPLPELAGDPRYRSLDVWRGLACLMVVLDHAAMATITWSDVQAAANPADFSARWLLYQATRLALGPPLFFVISGYCIAASVDSARRKGKGAGEFLLRRLWRTFPPYWAAVAVFAALVAGLDGAGLSRLYHGVVGLELFRPGEVTAAQWIGNLTLTETWRYCVWDGLPHVFTRVAWSLCYQEQFYAVCFVAALLAPRRLYGMLAGITAAVLALRAMAWDTGWLFRIDGLFPVYWHEFAVGLAVYWRLNVRTTAWPRRGVDLGLAGLAAIAASTGLGSTVVAALFGLLLIAARGRDERLARCRALEPVRACGRRCYSIYLIHLPACTVTLCLLHGLGLHDYWTRALVLVPAAMAAALAAGWTFYAVVERRFLNPPQRWVDTLRQRAEARRAETPEAGLEAATPERPMLAPAA